MADILEMIMLITFGVSWPINITKLWRVRSTKGSSVFFYCLIVLGYILGVISKAIKLNEGISTPVYVWFFYIFNACMVAVGIGVWCRNRMIERRERNEL